MEIQIKKIFDCDVLVIGGGFAGFGAAMGVAKQDACLG